MNYIAELLNASTIELSIGPLHLTGTGVAGAGAVVVVVIAIIIRLIKARPSSAQI